MATYVKFENFVEDLSAGVHQLIGTGGSTANMLIAYLTNAAPNAGTHEVKGDVAEIATGGGYAGPVNLDNVGSRTAGTVTVTAKSFTVLATSGGIAEFRYVSVANDTPTSPADPLISYFDYGSALSLADGESLTVKFNGADVGANGTLFTLA